MNMVFFLSLQIARREVDARDPKLGPVCLKVRIKMEDHNQPTTPLRAAIHLDGTTVPHTFYICINLPILKKGISSLACMVSHIVK